MATNKEQQATSDKQQATSDKRQATRNQQPATSIQQPATKLTRMPLITYPVCPSCRSAEISPALIAEDYTVSHESFQIWECATCTLRFTQQVPDSDSIGDYYKSENYISHTDTKKGFINSLYHM